MTNENRPSRAPAYRLILMLTLAVAVCGSTLAIAVQSRTDYEFFDPIIDVKALISRYAAEEPDREALQRGAIAGMLEALDDPYAEFVPAQFGEAFEQGLTGEYVGIGAEVLMGESALRIVSPLDDSPAFNAGVMAGDDVVAIDGERTAGMTQTEAISLLKGEPGTAVVLTIDRAGDEIEIEVTRDRIRQRSVRGFHRDGEGEWEYMVDPERRIAYIRLSQFTPSSAEHFVEALEQVGAADGTLGGLIIDLRFNPGGLLSTAVALADLFIDEGVIVSTNGRAYEEEVFSARSEGTLGDFPIAVLINGQSASASEVLSGAIQESGRGIVVGTRSFGKGSVQSVRGLSGAAAGAQLKLTEQRYYLPSGRSIQRQDDSAEWGVDPSPGFFVSMTDRETAEMLQVRREQEILRAGEDTDESRWSDPEWIVERLKDPQFGAAMRAVRARVDTGAWPESPEEGSGFDPVLAEELAGLLEARTRMFRQIARIERRIGVIEQASDDETAAAAADAIDLIPDGAEIEGGRLIVRDADGAVVAELVIESGDLERWLIDAGVRRAADDAAGAN